MSKILLLFIMLLFLNSKSISQIKFTGFGAAGYKYYDRIRLIESNQETYFEGKFQAEIEVNKNIEAQLDFRGESNDNVVELREYSAKFSYLEKLTFEVGNIKHPFTYERLESGEDLYTVERSFLSESLSEIGYAGRSVGIMAYYKFSKKRPEFPHSYYLFIFKNNNLQNGIVGRYTHHLTEDYSLTANVFHLNTGGDYPISSQAYAAEFRMNKKDFDMNLELVYMQDPVEGQRRLVNKLEEKVFGYGARFLTALGFDTGGSVIEEIEPVILLSYFQPDSELSEQHTIQTIGAVNFYFHDDVRLRLNADLRFSKNEFSDKYSTHNSRFIVEVQVRY